jgi:uncharacterized protein YciI
MKRLFAVTRERGPAWDHSRALEQQNDWQSHATFMDALAAEGFVLLAGPLVGTPRFLLIIRARDEDEIERRLSEDPWTRSDQLRIVDLRPWILRLGKLA